MTSRRRRRRRLPRRNKRIPRRNFPLWIAVGIVIFAILFVIAEIIRG